MTQCPTCGANPCGNPGFCALCRKADAKKRPRQDPHSRRLHKLIEPDIEAIILSVRERGIGALKDPSNIERLSRCDKAAMTQIEQRIAKLGKA